MKHLTITRLKRHWLGKPMFRVRSKYPVKGKIPVLGHVAWFERWKKYAYYPVRETIYEEVCMRDLATFCEKQTRLSKRDDIAKRAKAKRK